jgi:Tfp pilus assembly protein PilX
MNIGRKNRRSGTVIIMVLVCLVIVMALIGTLLQGTLRARRQLHAERDRRQAQWLLEAGLQRGLRRAAAAAEYRGETWRLSAEDVSGSGAGEITIELSEAGEGQRRRLSVVAEYPIGSKLSIRRSRTIFVPTTE